jgi:hypothetical protein
MAIVILDNMASRLNGFFLEEAPCVSTGFFTARSTKLFAWHNHEGHGVFLK